MIFFTVHDSKNIRTAALSRYDTLKFLMENCSDEELPNDVLFAVENYGPQTVSSRYLVTQHDTASL